jgi:hypothetical protein
MYKFAIMACHEVVQYKYMQMHHKKLYHGAVSVNSNLYPSEIKKFLPAASLVCIVCTREEKGGSRVARKSGGHNQRG